MRGGTTAGDAEGACAHAEQPALGVRELGAGEEGRHRIHVWVRAVERHVWRAAQPELEHVRGRACKRDHQVVALHVEEADARLGRGRRGRRLAPLRCRRARLHGHPCRVAIPGAALIIIAIAIVIVKVILLVIITTRAPIPSLMSGVVSATPTALVALPEANVLAAAMVRLVGTPPAIASVLLVLSIVGIAIVSSWPIGVGAVTQPHIVDIPRDGCRAGQHALA